jgi:uncharacterized OB-fold protein
MQKVEPNVTAPESELADPAFPELSEFWTAARRGQLLLRSCVECGRPHWYPRMICPFCRSRNLRWTPSDGHGLVHSFSVMRRVGQPYVLAFVRLADGVVLMTNIVDCDVDAVFIGQRVEVVFRMSEGGLPAPFFRPTADVP